MLKLADFENMSNQEVIDHIVTNYSDDGYGRLGVEVKESEVKTLLENYDVLVAYEHVGSWGCDSSSFFILKNKTSGSYAYVSGRHCSCYGFEGQFKPEDMPDEWFLRDDFTEYGYGGYDDDEEEHKRLVRKWVSENIGDGFDAEDPELWRIVLDCLSDDEDGQGYLFDHFKSIEYKIRTKFGET